MGEREDSLDGYDIRVALRKSHSGERTARVYIRCSKRGKTTKTDLPFPEKVDERKIKWATEGEERIASYHRRGSLEYYDSGWNKIPTNLAQRLEPLVLKTLKQ